MATHALPSPAARGVPRPELHLAGRIALAFLVLLGIGALGGGAALVARPDGSVMGFTVAELEGSPFADYLIPGLILGLLFGAGSLVAVAMGIRHDRLAPFLAFAIGCAQMIWIVVELLYIPFSPLHPIFFVVGLAIALAAVPWGWPTFTAWRARR